jgi:hypothetical protein
VRQEAKARGAKQLLAYAPLAPPAIAPAVLTGEGGGGDGKKQKTNKGMGDEENPALGFLRQKGGFKEDDQQKGADGASYTDRRGRACRRLVAAL